VSTAALNPPPQIQTIPQEPARLAWDLASQLLPVPDILVRHGLTPQDLKAMLKNTQFRHMVKEAQRVWTSPLNTTQRLRLKAAMAAEDGLEELYNIFRTPQNGLQSRLDAYKQITVLADVIPKKEQDAPGAGSPQFTVTINLSPDRTLTVSAPTALPPRAFESVPDAAASESEPLDA